MTKKSFGSHFVVIYLFTVSNLMTIELLLMIFE